VSAGLRGALVFGVLGLLAGLLVARRETPPPRRAVAAARRVREMRLQATGGPGRIVLALSDEAAPALWLSKGSRGGSLQLGLHGDDFPFALVSDAAVRSFGLGRVDGRQASPILVFRNDDEVRMALGLSMTEAGRPAFLVHYTADGRKHEVLGRYCDAPGRVCDR
jgi:hypothetical protein